MQIGVYNFQSYMKFSLPSFFLFHKNYKNFISGLFHVVKNTIKINTSTKRLYFNFKMFFWKSNRENTVSLTDRLDYTKFINFIHSQKMHVHTHKRTKWKADSLCKNLQFFLRKKPIKKYNKGIHSIILYRLTQWQVIARLSVVIALPRIKMWVTLLYTWN